MTGRVTSVHFNPLHDALLLTSSTDSSITLWRMFSVSSSRMKEKWARERGEEVGSKRTSRSSCSEGRERVFTVRRGARRTCGFSAERATRESCSSEMCRPRRSPYFWTRCDELVLFVGKTVEEKAKHNQNDSFTKYSIVTFSSKLWLFPNICGYLLLVRFLRFLLPWEWVQNGREK